VKKRKRKREHFWENNNLDVLIKITSKEYIIDVIYIYIYSQSYKLFYRKFSIDINKI